MTTKMRTQVRQRARGRCEYCKTPFRYDSVPWSIDHILAEQHGGKTLLNNLAIACAHCNRHKGPNIAGIDSMSGQIVRLFNPRSQKWSDHFRWSGALLTGLTPQARATIHVLAINSPAKMAARAALMEEGLF